MKFFQSLFSDSRPEPGDSLLRKPEVEARLEKLAHSSKAQHAAQLLRTPTALLRLSMEEATIVVSYMRPGHIKEGAVFIREGDTHHNDFMMLIMDGEVTVEANTPNHQSTTTISVLGPGSLIGEMALLDGEPRSANCTASTDLTFARLMRDDFEQLLSDDPVTGCKLLLAISYRIAERLRDTADKLKVSSRLIATLQQELDRAMPTPGSKIHIHSASSRT